MQYWKKSVKIQYLRGEGGVFRRRWRNKHWDSLLFTLLEYCLWNLSDMGQAKPCLIFENITTDEMKLYGELSITRTSHKTFFPKLKMEYQTYAHCSFSFSLIN